MTCRGCGKPDPRYPGIKLCENCYRSWLGGKSRGAEFDYWLAARQRRQGLAPTLAEDAVAGPEDDEVIEPGGGEDAGEPEVIPPRTRAEEHRPGAPLSSPMTGDPDGAPPRVTTPLGRARERIRSALGSNAPAGEHVREPTRETRPSNKRGRLSAAPAFADAFDFAGQVAVGSGRHVPLGRYLQWAGPASGELLDDAVKDSVVDRRLIQPAVKVYDRLGLAAAVLGPPAVILAIERTGEQLQLGPNGELAHPLFPLLKTAIRRSLPDLVPAMKRAKAREDKLDAAVRELWPDLPEGADPADAVLAMMFAGLTYVPPTPQAPPEQAPASEYAAA